MTTADAAPPETRSGASERELRRRAAVLWTILGVAIATYTALGVKRFLGATERSNMGDLPFFYDAFVAVRAGEDLYQSGAAGYIYPPLFAVLFSPLGALSIQHAGAVFAVANGVLLLTCLWLISADLIRRFGVVGNPGLLPAVMLVTLVVLADKIWSEIKLGQTDLLILTSLLLALRFLHRRPVLAGVLLGFAGNIKYQSVIFIPYLLVRRRWAALASFVATALGLAMSTALVFGWERNLAYLGQAQGGLARMMGSDASESAANVNAIDWGRSISFPSVLARIEAWAGWPSWTMPALTLTLAAACMALVVYFYRRHGHAVFVGRASDGRTQHGQALAAIEWIGLLVAVVVFSPQMTARHIVLLIPLVALAALVVLRRSHGVRRWPVLAAMVFLLLALILPPGGSAMKEAVAAWRWIGGASIATLALLLVTVWGALAWARRLKPGAAPIAPDAATAAPTHAPR